MIILALDTSSDSGSVAITAGGRLVGEVRLANSVQHSERLFESIDFLLKSSGLTVVEIDLFAAARGPGSFTGLRIGLAAVESLAFATNATARAISTLTALAWSMGPTSTLVAPVVDARRGEVHGALYRRSGNEVEELLSPRTASPRDFLAALPPEHLVMCGSGTEMCADGPVHDSWTINDQQIYLAIPVAQMAAASREEPFEPLYLRPPTVHKAAGPRDT